VPALASGTGTRCRQQWRWRRAYYDCRRGRGLERRVVGGATAAEAGDGTGKQAPAPAAPAAAAVPAVRLRQHQILLLQQLQPLTAAVPLQGVPPALDRGRHATRRARRRRPQEQARRQAETLFLLFGHGHGDGDGPGAAGRWRRQRRVPGRLAAGAVPARWGGGRRVWIQH
jgi:hypothetical protein